MTTIGMSITVNVKIYSYGQVAQLVERRMNDFWFMRVEQQLNFRWLLTRGSEVRVLPCPQSCSINTIRGTKPYPGISECTYGMLYG